MTILIAEDDLYTREGLIDILENKGLRLPRQRMARGLLSFINLNSPTAFVWI